MVGDALVALLDHPDVAAQQAGVVLVMHSLMHVQSVFPVEALLAHITHKRPLPCTQCFVDSNVLSECKLSLADVAGVSALVLSGTPPRHPNGSAGFALTWLVAGLMMFWWKELARVGIPFAVAPLVGLDTLPGVHREKTVGVLPALLSRDGAATASLHSLSKQTTGSRPCSRTRSRRQSGEG